MIDFGADRAERRQRQHVQCGSIVYPIPYPEEEMKLYCVTL